MMIYKELSLYDFIEEFKRMNRDYFSYEGYGVLYEVLPEFGGYEGFKMDVLAIVSDFTEASEDEILKAYSGTLVTIEELEDYTTAFKLNNGNYLFIEF